MPQPSNLGQVLDPATGKGTNATNGSVLFKNITAAGNTLVKAGTAHLRSLIIGTGAAGATVTLYDGVDATGTKIGTFNAANSGSFSLNAAIKVGIFAVVAGGAPDVTVMYL